MIRLIPLVALAAISPAFAQTAAPSPAPEPQMTPPPPEFMTAAQAFGECLQGGSAAAPATVTPEAAAHQVLLSCAAQKATLTTQFEGWVGGPQFPEAGRAPARAKFTEQMNGLEAKLAAGIRQYRATPAPAATPTPAPQPAKP